MNRRLGLAGTLWRVGLGLALCLPVVACKSRSSGPQAPVVESEAVVDVEEPVGPGAWWRHAPRVGFIEDIGGEAAPYQVRNKWIGKLLPPRHLESQQVASADATAAQHAELLESSSGHGSVFWVDGVYGDSGSRRVVWLVPQFHQSSDFPVLWASLGEEIVQVQDNVDALLTLLVQQHRVRCVGTEGSAAKKLRRSADLDRVGGWAQRLTNLYHLVMREVAAEDDRIGPGATVVMEKLEPYFERYARTRDGVGLALSRLTLGREDDESNGTGEVHRFGLEDSALNRSALSLLKQVRRLQKKQILIAPLVEGEDDQALREMWLSQYPRFKKNVADPIEVTLGTLRRIRLELAWGGAREEAALLGRFIGHVKMIFTEILRPQDVLDYYDYYQEIHGKGEQRGSGDASRLNRSLTQTEVARNKRLQNKIDKMWARYVKVSHRDRERVAVARTLENMSRGAVASCAIVMGHSHAEALREQLLEAADGTAVIVVRPYSLE